MSSDYKFLLIPHTELHQKAFLMLTTTQEYSIQPGLNINRMITHYHPKEMKMVKSRDVINISEITKVEMCDGKDLICISLGYKYGTVTEDLNATILYNHLVSFGKVIVVRDEDFNESLDCDHVSNLNDHLYTRTRGSVIRSLRMELLVA